jgi:hypothetical protein
MSDFKDSLELMDNIVVDELVEELSEQAIVPFLNLAAKPLQQSHEKGC